MRHLAVLLSIFLSLVSCGKREEVTTEETRPLTMRDQDLELDVSADERFRQGRQAPATTVEAPPSPVVAGTVPAGWEALPSTGFRLVNYRFGSEGQAYVSLSRGGIFENVNRWRKQFGADPLDAAGIEALEKIEVAGFKGVWLEVDGDFGGGMGQAAQSDWSLRGVVAEGDEGILTVKMLGPAAEVVAEGGKLRAFVEGLERAN